MGSDNEGNLARIFIDTGANCNTIRRKFCSTLLDQGLKCAFHPGPREGIDMNLVGGSQHLGVSCDKATFMTEVKTTWESFYSEQKYILGPKRGGFGYGRYLV